MNKNNTDFYARVFVLNNTGIDLFFHVDELDPGKATIIIDVASFPESKNTQLSDCLEHSTIFQIDIFPNRKNDKSVFNDHCLLIKDAYVFSVNDEIEATKDEEGKECLDLTYTIRPKYLPPVNDPVPKN